MNRANVFGIGAKTVNALHALGATVRSAGLSKELLHLVHFRVSQINGCAFCLDMHSKEARADGETEQRLYTLSTWRETPFFTKKERVALAWTEAVTTLNEISDEVYAELQSEFTEQEIVDLTMSIVTTNSYNILNIAFRREAGGYEAGSLLKVKSA
jgi:AhpD family alkylhydroperoxidase